LAASPADAQRQHRNATRPGNSNAAAAAAATAAAAAKAPKGQKVAVKQPIFCEVLDSRTQKLISSHPTLGKSCQFLVSNRLISKVSSRRVFFVVSRQKKKKQGPDFSTDVTYYPLWKIE
jgi:hypothetical protein